MDEHRIWSEDQNVMIMESDNHNIHNPILTTAWDNLSSESEGSF